MSNPSNLGDWVSACRAEGFDPAELRLVLERYRAYRGYHQQGRGAEPLPLARWFAWYRMENGSEAGQQAPSPSGCSVDEGSRNRGAIRKPAAFLRLLQQMLVAESGGADGVAPRGFFGD
jgi:hypothetical protein